MEGVGDVKREGEEEGGSIQTGCRWRGWSSHWKAALRERGVCLICRRTRKRRGKSSVAQQEESEGEEIAERNAGR
jgi:hypothetical protein